MKLPITFLFEMKVDGEVYRAMQYEDRKHLTELALHVSPHLDMIYYTFYLSDINKVRMIMQKYGIMLTYPKKAEIRQYGLSYSGLSLEIEGQGDSFLIRQYFPDGRIETHIIPKDRVFTVYYILKEHKGRFKGSDVWPEICRKFHIDRFFDRHGRFHKNSFNGARSTYFNFYYYPVKVLEHIGKIRFENGYIEVIE